MSFWDDPSGPLLKQQHRWVVSLGNSDFDPAKETDTNKNTIPFYYAKSVDQPSYTIKTVQAKYLYSHTFNFPTRPVWNSISITFYDVLMNQKDASLVIDPTVSLYEDFLKKGKGKPVKFRDQIVVEGKVAARNVSDTIKLKQSTQLFFYALLQSAGYITPHETDNENNLMRFKSFNFKKNMIKAIVGDSPDYINNTAIQGNEIKLDGNISKSSDWKYLSIWHLDAEGNQTHGWKLYNPMVTDVKMDRLDYSSENAVTITAKIEYDWAAVLENAPIGTTLGSQKIPLEAEVAIGSITRKVQQFRVGDILAGAEGQTEAEKLDTLNERRKQARDELLRIYEAANPQAKEEQIAAEQAKIAANLPDFTEVPVDERTLIGAAVGQFPELENVAANPQRLAIQLPLQEERDRPAVGKDPVPSLPDSEVVELKDFTPAQQKVFDEELTKALALLQGTDDSESVKIEEATRVAQALASTVPKETTLTDLAKQAIAEATPEQITTPEFLSEKIYGDFIPEKDLPILQDLINKKLIEVDKPYSEAKQKVLSANAEQLEAIIKSGDLLNDLTGRQQSDLVDLISKRLESSRAGSASPPVDPVPAPTTPQAAINALETWLSAQANFKY